MAPGARIGTMSQECLKPQVTSKVSGGQPALLGWLQFGLYSLWVKISLRDIHIKKSATAINKNNQKSSKFSKQTHINKNQTNIKLYIALYNKLIKHHQNPRNNIKHHQLGHFFLSRATWHHGSIQPGQRQTKTQGQSHGGLGHLGLYSEVDHVPPISTFQWERERERNRSMDGWMDG